MIATTATLTGSSAEALGTAEAILADWRAHGAEGHFLARNLDTGEELGFAADSPVPLASVAKLPIALAVLELIARRAVDGSTPIEVDPVLTSPGPTGSAQFRHPARIALGDLLFLAITLSDNAAADLVLEHVGLAAITETIAGWECGEIAIRHPMRWMSDSAVAAGGADVDSAMALVLRGRETGQAEIAALDPTRANTGSARALVDLLDGIWRDTLSLPAATAEIRRLLDLSLFSQRLAAELRSDGIRVSSKTGSFLHLRHEAGVVEPVSGDRIAVAALSACPRPARLAPDIDLAIAGAARTAFELLRR